MLPAFLTTLCFSISAVSASRMARILGGVEANFWRILLATLLLGLYAHTFGGGLAGPALGMFLLSGLVGFGVGDVALYQALPRLGSRLSMVLVHCLAAPMAALAEWLWMGEAVTPREIGCGLVILAGVAVALAPSGLAHIPRRALWIGAACGCVAAFGQGMGAVLSRKANLITEAAGFAIDGSTAAYQRIWGGVLVAGISFALLKWRRAGCPPPEGRPPGWGALRQAGKWIGVNAMAGPVLGVSCFQWALATTKTGVVLPIVALTPLVIIPFSRWIEGEKPSRRSLLGGAVAVAGVVLLKLNLAD